MLAELLAPMPLLVWSLVYLLQIRRTLKDKLIAMPLVPLCLNVGWEIYFSFVGGNYAVLLWLAPNLVLLYLAYRYGPNDYLSPIIQRWFTVGFVAVVAASFALVFAFMEAFEDTTGVKSAAFTLLAYSTLFPAMLLRRDSVRGQSMYIALAILIGDAASYPVMMQLGLESDTPLLWLRTVYGYAIAMHLLYLAGYIHVARRDNVPLWTRI